MRKVWEIFNYLVLSFILTYLLVLLYIIPMDRVDTVPMSLFYLFTIPFYYFVALLIIFVVLLPFALHRYLRYIYLFVKSIFDFWLVMDFLVFRNYKFHIDSLFLDMLLHDIGGLGLSTLCVSYLCGYIYLFAVYQSIFTSYITKA